MSDDDKSMYVQLICNQPIVTYDKLRRIHPLGLSSPGAYSLEIIDLHVVKIQGMNLMGLNVPCYDHLEMISLRSVRKYMGDEPNETFPPLGRLLTTTDDIYK